MDGWDAARQRLGRKRLLILFSLIAQIMGFAALAVLVIAL